MSDTRPWTLDDLSTTPPDDDEGSRHPARRARHAAGEPPVERPDPATDPLAFLASRGTGPQHARPAASAPNRRTMLAIGATAAAVAACGGSSHVRKAIGGAIDHVVGDGDPGSATTPIAEAPAPTVPAVAPSPGKTAPGVADPVGMGGAGSGGVGDGGTGPSPTTGGIQGTFPDRDTSYAGSSKHPAPVPPAGSPRITIGSASTARPSMPTPLATDPFEHVQSRFSFGATPTQRADVHRLGLERWLGQQLAPRATGYAGVPQVASAFPLLAKSGPQVRAALKAAGNEFGWDAMDQLSRATLALQMWSPWQVYERMVDFWANHLSIANHSDGVEVSRHVFDRDVIRRNALGRFSDMLLAAAKSPAMLRYLNQAESSKGSPNENYARELMELHTIGVSAGYTETDVRSVAYLLTGRTYDNDSYVFKTSWHYVGPIKALTFSHPNATAAGGEAAGDAFLNYLAHHPSTATQIARKLAVRFVSDTPPDSLVTRLAKTYLANGTAILPVLRTLFSSTEFWASRGQKTRRPAENLVAALRTRGAQPGADLNKGLGDLVYRLSLMNHAPLDWKPPNGYPDVARAWVSSGSMVETWRAHRDITGGYLGTAGLTYGPLPGVWGGRTPATAGAAVDALALRLVGQRLPATERAAMLTFLGATETTATKSADLSGLLGQASALLLDSVYHALR